MDEFRKQPLGEKGRGLLRSLLPLLQWGSLVMSLLLALLIAQASLQRRRVRPSELPALEKLLAAKPEGETAGEWRQTVRDLDLMARSAYFTNIQFRRRLTLALAVFLAVFLVSAKLKRRLLDRETPRRHAGPHARAPPCPGEPAHRPGSGHRRRPGRSEAERRGEGLRRHRLVLLGRRRPAPPVARDGFAKGRELG